jgi:hypothetical protein
MTPGKHKVVSPKEIAQARSEGWQVRDSILILAPGPRLEVLFLVRRPLGGTVAENVLEHGCGALNIDACRVPTQDDLNGGCYRNSGDSDDIHWGGLRNKETGKYAQPAGRWPPNVLVVHDAVCLPTVCSEKCSVTLLDAQSEPTKSCASKQHHESYGDRPSTTHFLRGWSHAGNQYEDSGNVSRFYPRLRDQAEVMAWIEKLIG